MAHLTRWWYQTVVADYDLTNSADVDELAELLSSGVDTPGIWKVSPKGWPKGEIVSWDGQLNVREVIVEVEVEPAAATGVDESAGDLPPADPPGSPAGPGGSTDLP